MLPDWMGGGVTTEKKPKRGGAGSAAGLGAAAVPKVPDWAKDDSTPSTSGSPALAALQEAAKPQLNPMAKTDHLAALSNDLGIFGGALTPAAEEAKKSSTQGQLDALTKLVTGDGKPEEKLQARGEDLKPRAMTREEYLGLPASVRAAVDFNTMLVEARKLDRAQLRAGELPKVQDKVNLGTITMPNGMPMQAAPSTTSQTLPEGYADVFESVFGEKPTRLTGVGMGPDTKKVESEKLPPVRPEVLSVLKQIGYKTDDPNEMRAFLTLENGISQTDIDNYLLDNDKPKPGDVSFSALAGGPRKGEREVFVEKIADLTLDLQEKLAKGDKMVADFQTSALKDREADRLYLGADVQKVELPEGFGDRKVDKLFQETFEYLLQQPDQAALQNELSVFNGYLSDQGLNPDTFLDFAQTKLEQADRGGELGAGVSIEDKNKPFKYRTPDEYRTLFGLTKER